MVAADRKWLSTPSYSWLFDNRLHPKQPLKTLRRWQRAQARRTPSSRGWWEAQRRIDQAHHRAAGLRDNAHHHVSRTLVHKYHTLGVETLNVAGMIKAGLQSKGLGRRRNIRPAEPDPL